jgi:membrane protease YdiL (CAAX protease family)
MFDYLRSTRHPLASLLYVLPMLVVYEVGVIILGGGFAGSNELRNGADAWARSQLTVGEVSFGWVLPLLVLALLVSLTAWRWGEKPARPLATGFGMFLESVGYAVALWALSRNFLPLLDRVGLPTQSVELKQVAAGQVVRFVGAGVYEEVLFRLGLFGGLVLLIRCAFVPKLLAVGLGALLASLAFAAAHHIGPAGEPLTAPVFLFRTAAGLIFTAVYATRGLGVAVGAHAGYNILVGVSVG